MKHLINQKMRRMNYLFWQPTTRSSLAHCSYLGMACLRRQSSSVLQPSCLFTLQMSHLENIRAQNHSLWFSDVLIRLQEVWFPVALLNLRPETKIMEVNSFQTKVFIFLLLATLKCKMSFLWSGQNTRTHSWKGWKEKKIPYSPF